MNKAKSHLVYLGVGSNINPVENIQSGLQLLQERLNVTRRSPLYRSVAVGSAGAPDFINGVFCITTDADPRTLKFEILRPVEAKLGRVRGEDKNAPRPIDLDILLFDSVVIAEPDLIIPDPGVYTYPFVAIPLLDVSPQVVLPDSGKALKTLFPGTAESYGLLRVDLD